MNTIGKRRRLFYLLITLVFLTVSSGLQARQIDDTVFTLKAQALKEKGKWLVRVRVLAKGPYHCNVEYPWKVKVKSIKGATVEKELFKRADSKTFSSDEVRFDIPLQNATNGSVQLEVKFSMCDEKQCFMKTVPVTLAFP